MVRSKNRFEKTLANLEKIVDQLETGDLTLDESIAAYEQGVKALKQCYEILRDAEKKVEILLESEDSTQESAPFEPGDQPSDAET